MDFANILTIVNSLLGVLFLILAYTYIVKLEKIGCACSVHPYRKYVKGMIIFLVVYLLVTMFIPPATLAKVLGPQSGIIMMIIYTLVAIVGIVFWILTIIYIRYLKKEKCKCSEDLRREIVYVISIIEVIAIFLAVILGILLGVVSSALMLVLTTVKDVERSHSTIANAVANPIDAAVSIPSNLKKLPKTLKKFSLKKK